MAGAAAAALSLSVEHQQRAGCSVVVVAAAAAHQHRVGCLAAVAAAALPLSVEHQRRVGCAAALLPLSRCRGVQGCPGVRRARLLLSRLCIHKGQTLAAIKVGHGHHGSMAILTTDLPQN